jgi:hypothetical protein
LADQQARIRQQAEALALKLRAHQIPSGDLETAIAAMRRLEAAARLADGPGLRQQHSRIIDALGQARETVKTETGLLREQNHLPGWMRDEISAGLRDGTPKGYEEMVAEYFRALAGRDQ